MCMSLIVVGDWVIVLLVGWSCELQRWRCFGLMLIKNKRGEQMRRCGEVDNFSG